MKGRILKILISLSLIICIGIFGAVMTSCDNNDDDTLTDYKVVYDGNAIYRSEHLDFVALCNSYEELKEVCSQNNYYFFDRNKDFDYFEKDYDTVAGIKIRGYTRQYFNNRSLVICAIMRRSDIGDFDIDAVEVDAGNLTVKIKRPHSDIANDREIGFFFIIEVNKAFVKDVTNTTYVYLDVVKEL